MPERPDLDLYVAHLQRRIVGERLEGLRLGSPFVLRTAEPDPARLVGRAVRDVRRLAKRLVLDLEGEFNVVVHLMVTGRLHWRRTGAALPRRGGLAAFDFASGALTLTESAKKKRASIHLCADRAALAAFDTTGIEVTSDGFDAFVAALRRENHTLKRALTDQRILRGIGNAYSDEILWAARLSPMKQSAKLTDGELGALFFAANSVLDDWTRRLALEAGDAFPEKVSAFHAEMAVHGRFRQPCRRCGAPVQRIVFAENEANYWAACQTGGRLLADRALSRLLHEDWPKRLEDLDGA
ncbi:MAG: DNA-formamidopyrimidine glycosylase family protein [Pseudomonadales bacterium]|jgi:formamidopyrimidine-DNA glycosylase|nr:DNA-formamidopyrimidine glycosylase family protein [Pseudomonadales bacterium]